MGILHNGIGGSFIGRSGNMVYYMLDGQNIGRRIGINLNPPTEKQLRCRQQIALVAQLLNPIKELVKTGYQAKAINMLRQPYVLATSYHKTNAILGEYPNQYLDFTALQFSSGSLPKPQTATVVCTENELLFSWTNRSNMSFTEGRDQVMLLAYYPELEAATYTLYGSERRTGSATLELSPAFEHGCVETYMAFISADRKHVSTSVYTGQLAI